MTPTTCSRRVDVDALADDRRVAAERALPEVEGQQDGRRAGDVVFGMQRAAQ